jgi:hypothetical protein
MNMNRKTTVLLFALLFSMTAVAQTFFSTTTVTCSEKGDRRTSFSASIEYPVSGEKKSLGAVREWICSILETDVPDKLEEADFRSLLRNCCGQFLIDADGTERSIEIYRSYEDESCVTFEAEVIDKDSEKWISQDCATFSKRDGHRLTVDEIFACGESKIKELMWEYRGDLPMAVGSAKELVVGEAGFIDGWVIVIGPAVNYTGAAYRLRYPEIEQYLRKGHSGGYY